MSFSFRHALGSVAEALGKVPKCIRSFKDKYDKNKKETQHKRNIVRLQRAVAREEKEERARREFMISRRYNIRRYQYIDARPPGVRTRGGRPEPKTYGKVHGCGRPYGRLSSV